MAMSIWHSSSEPTIVHSAKSLLLPSLLPLLPLRHKTKVIFVSNDRDEENYEASCMKVIGIDVMDYDLSKTAQMRDLFGLKTIPANDTSEQRLPQR